eukprot:scaffold28544_cov126-Skeletonema_dohrnii-CCMP3373.AAC.5
MPALKITNRQQLGNSYVFVPTTTALQSLCTTLLATSYLHLNHRHAMQHEQRASVYVWNLSTLSIYLSDNCTGKAVSIESTYV